MQEPLFEQRPWGTYEIISRFPIEAGQEIKVKKIVVAPGKRLSYQSHEKREEMWYIASGVASVVLEGIESEVLPGATVFVPLNAKHRIGNSTEAELVFIEIAKGICDESDITRYEDDFDRAKIN